LYEEKQEKEERRNKLHAEIDAWQEKLRLKEQEAKEVWSGLSFFVLYISSVHILNP
jgi:hypothetical protein